MRKTLSLYISAFFVSLGGLLAGYDTGVISGALLYIDKSFALTSQNIGLLVSIVSFGAVGGAFLNGLFADKIGRKNLLLLTSLIFIFGSIFCFASQNVVQLIFSRAIVGCAVGTVSFACPLYLGEISPKDKRGGIVSLYQLAITFGILISYLVNFFCSDFYLSWRLMFLLGAVPAVILFVAMCFQSDTPRWLVFKNRIVEAKKVLFKYSFESDIDFEIKNIQKTLLSDISQKKKSVFNKALLMPFVVGIGIMAVQICTGINAIIYYCPTVFKLIGFSSNHDVLKLTVFIGLINFLMTFFAIKFVDKLGRKKLLYIGLAGMFLCLAGLSASFVLSFEIAKYLTIFFAGFYIIFFSMSLGPVALLLISEVFPLAYRARAMSCAIIFNFIFNFIVTGVFPVLIDKIGGCYTFLTFAFICILSLLFVIFVVPETKDITLEELELKFKTL